MHENLKKIFDLAPSALVLARKFRIGKKALPYGAIWKRLKTEK